ncbi:MAG: hypothetical protein LBH41_01575 [Rickettsiales bacterium]|nr:hypothetical protein [Rickettsiales bacterium]
MKIRDEIKELEKIELEYD